MHVPPSCCMHGVQVHCQQALPCITDKLHVYGDSTVHVIKHGFSLTHDSQNFLVLPLSEGRDHPLCCPLRLRTPCFWDRNMTLLCALASTSGAHRAIVGTNRSRTSRSFWPCASSSRRPALHLLQAANDDGASTSKGSVEPKAEPSRLAPAWGARCRCA